MRAKFKEVLPFRGIDDKDEPPGMVVPIGGKNVVRLRDGRGLTLEPPRSLAVTEVEMFSGLSTRDRFFEVSDRRQRRGYHNIWAVDPGTGPAKRRVAKLVVTVHERKTLTVAFNFVKDETGRQLSKRDRSQVQGWIDELNGIFTPQANIVLEQKLTRDLTVDELKAPVTTRNWHLISGRGSHQAQLNVFLVGKWEGAGPRDDPFGSYFRNTPEIVVDDRPNVWLFWETLAHEVGHYLGGGDYPNRPRLLMNPGQGIKITHQQVLNWNPI